MVSWWRRWHLGTVAGLIVAGYLTVALVQIVKRNYQLKRQITDYEGQLARLQTDKTELEYKLRYYQTDAFKEKEARAKLGLQQPGENVIILPQPSSAPTSPAENRPGRHRSNFEQWWEFLFG